MINSSKILGIAMIALFIASATCLVSARPIPNDCIGIYAINFIPEEVNVTSYYGNGTVKESSLIPAHDEFGASDSVDILVPKNGKIGVNDVDFLPAYNEERGRHITVADIYYVNGNSYSTTRMDGSKIGFHRYSRTLMDGSEIEFHR